MQYRPLGSTGLDVSKICLGTMTFGEQNTEAEAHAQLDFAVDSGINFIDTAEMYSVPGRKETQGSTERYIGTWLKKRQNRDKLIVATKIAGPSPGLLFIRDPLNFSKGSIYEAVEGSLSRLQTDYIDIYQLHWPERNMNKFGQLGYIHNDDELWQDNLLDVIQNLAKLIEQGKIRHYGISNESPWGAMKFLQLATENGLPRPVTIQNPYSLLNRSYEVGLAEISMRETIGLLAYSPLAFGLLSGKYHDGSNVSNCRLKLFPKFKRYTGEYVYQVAQKYINIANKYSLNPSQMALAYVHTRPFVWSTILGATNMEQLKQNVESLNISISEACLAEIEGVHTVNSNPAP